jgi:uncharacterized OB-fold protein
MEPASPPPIPDDSTTNFFWQAARRHELHIQRCRACGTFIHMPRPVCRGCGSFDLGPERVSGRATLYSWTRTFKAFHPYFVDKLPYVVATVTLAEQEGLQLQTNLVDVDDADVAIGMALEVDFRELAPGYVLPVFRPAAAA